MAKRYPEVIANSDGWSEWLHMRQGYRMACCDCGLVHNLEFKVARKSRAKARPGYIVLGKPITSALVFMRAGRNNRATAQLRRRKP